jgi:hypothetical protein
MPKHTLKPAHPFKPVPVPNKPSSRAVQSKKVLKQAQIQNVDFIKKSVVVKESPMAGLNYITHVLIPQTFLQSVDGIYSLFG